MPQQCLFLTPKVMLVNVYYKTQTGTDGKESSEIEQFAGGAWGEIFTRPERVRQQLLE